MHCELATKVPVAALVLMAAAAALAAVEPPPTMPQASGAGGSTARRDFYWLRSFLAGGGCPPRALATLRVAGAGRVHAAATTFLDSGCSNVLPDVCPDLL